MNIIFISLIFTSILSFLLFIRYLLFSVEESQNSAIHRRLDSFGKKANVSQMHLNSALFRKKKDHNKAFHKFIRQLSINNYFQKLLRKAGEPISIETLYLILILLQLFALILSLIVQAGLYTFILMALMAYSPIYILRTISQKRLSVFETQFPEATDLMARALRSGHSFSSALSMISQEMHPPISEEFSKVSEDYAYGKTMEDALSGLMQRVELTDVNFFVTAVLLQRETGGNLTEVLDNIGYIVRERFRLLRTVKTLSAEGRLSGIILALMPPALMGVLYILSPQYINMAFEHPVGQTMLMIGAFFEIMGIFVIKYLVNIEV
ncbi:type II secretion system F domain protein [Candidatus Magnetomorum sp. HK-1]|nr:type II secretion system F domain protein [Candidatus Magnetomorum sp. HK-1]